MKNEVNITSVTGANEVKTPTNSPFTIGNIIPSEHARMIAEMADRVVSEGKIVPLDRGDSHPRGEGEAVKTTISNPVQTPITPFKGFLG